MDELERIKYLIALGNELLATYRSNPNSNIITSNPVNLNTQAFSSWCVQCKSFLKPYETYKNEFTKKATRANRSRVEAGIGILKGLQTEIEFGEQSEEQKSSHEVSPSTIKKEINNPTVNINISMLVKLLREIYNIDELQDLCMNLTLEYENFEGGKNNRIREIVTYMNREKRLNELIKEAFAMKEKSAIIFIENCIE